MKKHTIIHLAMPIGVAVTILTPVFGVTAANAVPPTNVMQASSKTKPTVVTHAEKVVEEQKLVLKTAFKKRHARYVAGATGPNSFDCSGFSLYVYRKALGKHLPHYSGAQMKQTKRVSRKHLQRGDLLFYGSHGSQHVSIYIGHGEQIAANNPRVGVQIDSINAPWWRGIYAGAGRIIK